MTSAATALYPPIAFQPDPVAADAAAAPATVLAVPLASAPPARRHARHHLYRGTRGLAFVLLGIAGLGVMGVGALASQIVPAYPTTTAGDAHLFGTLLRVAPFVMLAGLAQLLVTWAVVRDKRNALPIGLALALGGAAVSGSFAVALVVGGGSSLVATTSAGTDLAGMLVWVAALDVLGALAVRRIIRGRAAR